MEEKDDELVERVDMVLERIEVFHKGESKVFRDFGEALNYAKKMTQFEDEYNHAYVVRKVKVSHLPYKSYIHHVEWIDGSIWLISDLL